MASKENGEVKNEIVEEIEFTSTDKIMKLGDFIPIYVPGVDKGLIPNHGHRQRRFLDFLRARPSRDWFVRSGFVGRLSPFAFLRRRRNAASSGDEVTDVDQGPAAVVPGRRHFRVPFVRKIHWGALFKKFLRWSKDPAHMAFIIWLLFCGAGLILLGLLAIGALDEAIPSSSRRKKWTEIVNQILNALFMIMCLYEHPKIFHHLILLCRWNSNDKVEIRKVYCKDGGVRRFERAHMMLVVVLFHITCFSQYALCGLYWGYSRKTRPDLGVNICIGVGVGAPIIAFVYIMKSPLGRKYETESNREESQATPAAPNEVELNRLEGKVVVTSPQWIGGLFDCRDDPTVGCYSFCCTFCVFGWNMERLGFGNMYVHIFTFLLLCTGPFLVFSASALSINDDEIRFGVGGIGLGLCFFGLLYGGYWRAEMRKRFKLPGNPLCCGSPSTTDCLQWLFCWSCSLAQEVRTGNFYDIEDNSFYRDMEEDERPVVLNPLPREGEIGFSFGIDGNYGPRSKSSPPSLGPNDPRIVLELANNSNGSPNGFPAGINRSVTVHAMRAPLPPLIQLDG